MTDQLVTILNKRRMGRRMQNYFTRSFIIYYGDMQWRWNMYVEMGKT